MYKYVFLDLDGTLTDSGEGITNSVAYALNKFGIDVPDKTALNVFIGPPLVDSFQMFFGLSESDSKLAVEYYREYFSVKGIFENKLYDGIEDMLKALRNAGCKLMLATSKPEHFAVPVLEYFGLKDYFDCITGASMDGKVSLKTDVITLALSRAGLSGAGLDEAELSGAESSVARLSGAKSSGAESLDARRSGAKLEEAIMVGDRKHDIEGGIANGLKTLGVLYGFGDYEELKAAGADYIAATPAEIVDIVCG